MQKAICPCCGFPTLEKRDNDDICKICKWQDDGQDDPHADEVFGGPNYDYSLTEARKNFKNNGIMFRESDNKNLRKYSDE
ncbi:CPCC family cysteine-rich protein [Paenisporosarcina indica]|uniref:CPCC family cysteine-rich protein n=1 Tax=Paenisporosarcina indica TaxID=650093 RepID=UPI00094FFDAC|nr:CPCC family cysteine-rich protein [Paenisporosarcina indica]